MRAASASPRMALAFGRLGGAAFILWAPAACTPLQLVECTPESSDVELCQEADEEEAPPVGWVALGDSEVVAWPARLEAPLPEAGGVSATPGASNTPALALSPDGAAVLAWDDQGGVGSTHAYARRLDASVWEEAGEGSATGAGLGPLNADVVAPMAAIIDATGNPIVAWTQAAGVWQLVVKRFDGSGWHALPGAASSGVVSTSEDPSQPSLAHDPVTGTTYVAWKHAAAGESAIYVRQHAGDGWQEVGAGSASGTGVSASSGEVDQPQLALDPAGRPVLVWLDQSSGAREVYLKGWDGSAWVSLPGADGTPAGSATGAGVSDTASDTDNPTLAVDGDGNPAVAWTVVTGPSRGVRLRLYDGAAWVGLGGSDIDGLPQAVALGGDAALALVHHERLGFVVSWAQATPEGYEIYLLHFADGAWREIEGSASGGGLSNSAGHSGAPSLAADERKVCVAWSEAMDGGSDVLIRCTYPR